MALKANYEFLFVGKDDNSFLENYSYDLFQEYGDKSGQVFINLEIQNNPVDAEELGTVIFETMQKVFFEDVGKDPYERFEVALKAVNSVLAQFKAQKVSGYIGNLNVVISAIVDDALYLSQTGDAEAYLVRKHYVSIVSDGLSDDATDGGDVFVNIASGKIEVGDLVLFSSTRLLRYISKTDLARCVAKSGVSDTLSEVKDVISTEILGRIGLTGMLFEVALKDEVKAVEENVDVATKTILESSESHVSARKESVTGRFFTAIKNYRRKKSEVFQGGGSGKSVFSKVKDAVSNFWEGLFSKGFGRNKILVLLVVVIVVLAGGIWVAKGNLAQRDELNRLDGVLTGVQEKIVEASTKASYDKETAKTVLDKAYEEAMTVLNSGYYRDKAILCLNQIEEARGKMDNIQIIKDPKVLADLSQKRPNVNALGFVKVGDRFFAFEYNALYEIVLDQVQDPLTIDDEETVIAASGFEERKSLMFLTKSGKMIEYRNGTMSFVDTDDGAFHKASAIKDWSNKIYLLDTAGNQLWKYTYKGTREKFGPAEPYFSADRDISNVKQFAIDSNVYLLETSGNILKFYGGTKAEFSIKNAPLNSFKNPTAIYTNDKLDQVYVLDSQESKVFVFLKDIKTGNLLYTSQYLFEGVGELRDISVDPDAKKLFVLTPTKILEVAY